MSVSSITRIFWPKYHKYHCHLINGKNKICTKNILPYPISFEIQNTYNVFVLMLGQRSKFYFDDY